MAVANLLNYKVLRKNDVKKGTKIRNVDSEDCYISVSLSATSGQKTDSIDTKFNWLFPLAFF